MELRQLRYFLAIADSGSFSKAAQRVFIAQSALSHQVAQLEDELGAPLFHRSRRGVELTEAGSRFHPHAVSILRQADEAMASARSDGVVPSGKVVFGIPHSVSHALALPLLREATLVILLDLPVALLALLAAFAYAHYLARPRWQSAVLFGLLASAAILAKGTGAALALV
eukprot:gene48035-58839_t